MQGHKIKNPRTQIYKQLQSIPQKIAVIITGTPMQNNLMELFALFDFVSPVSLLSKLHDCVDMTGTADSQPVCPSRNTQKTIIIKVRNTLGHHKENRSKIFPSRCCLIAVMSLPQRQPDYEACDSHFWMAHGCIAG